MKSKENIAYLLFISVVAALGGFLYGYDTAVISGTIRLVTDQFTLSAYGTGWYVGAALLGSIIGVIFAGGLSDHYGRKHTLIASSILFTASAAGCAYAGSFETLVIYRLIGGVGTGLVSVVSPLYISEVSIAKYRGRLVTLYQLAITVGFLGAYLVNYGLLSLADSITEQNSGMVYWMFNQEIWRGMLGVEVVPALVFIGILFFIPESPRWLMLKRNGDRARRFLQKILRDVNAVEEEVVSICQIISQEGNKVSLKECLTMNTMRLLLFGSMIAIMGQFMGVNAVLYYGPTIFQEAGLSGGDSLLYQALIGLVNMLTTVVGLLIIDKVGRKRLVYFGVTGMFVTLIFIAFYFVKGETLGVSPVFMLVCFLTYIFFCAISICLVIWVLLSEIYPIRIRGLAMSVSGMFLWIGTFLVGQLTPVFLDKLGTSGTFLMFATVCIPYILVVRYGIPETTGRSLEEIEQEVNGIKNV